MNFFMMQSLGTYTKNMEMQMKWQQKKAKNDFTADGSTKLNDPTARQAEELRLAQADGSSKISAQIRTKLATGKKLTQEEMQYLQKNDPQTYQKARAIEEERKSYEEELKRCETKEDVERVKMNHTAAALSVVNSVKSNPAIPEGAKLGIIWQQLQKVMAMEEAISEFVKSGRYAELPTEAEKLAAEKALEEAKDAELGIEDPAENTERADADKKETDASSGTEDVSKDISGNISDDISANIADDILGDIARDVSLHESEQQNRAMLQEHKKTLAKAEATPEAMKVRRAKVQAAYKGNELQISEQIMDLKK